MHVNENCIKFSANGVGATSSSKGPLLYEFELGTMYCLTFALFSQFFCTVYINVFFTIYLIFLYRAQLLHKSHGNIKTLNQLLSTFIQSYLMVFLHLWLSLSLVNIVSLPDKLISVWKKKVMSGGQNWLAPI